MHLHYLNFALGRRYSRNNEGIACITQLFKSKLQRSSNQSSLKIIRPEVDHIIKISEEIHAYLMFNYTVLEN